MGKLSISLSDEIDQKVRDIAETEYHGKKGALSIIVEGIIRDWLASNGKLSN